MRLIFLLAVFLATGNSFAAERFVAVCAYNGDGTAPACAAGPGGAGAFNTVQAAADIVQAGDVVNIKAGIHKGRVVMKTSGQAGSPIVFQGEPGAVIDGGDAVTGWVPAPEMANGVYKKTGLSYVPKNATWNNKFILEIRESNMANGSGFQLLKNSSTTIGAFGLNVWDGIEVWYGSTTTYTSTPTTYIRFRDGRNPNNEQITFAPKQVGAVGLSNKSFIVIKGLTIRNAYSAVYLSGGSSDNIIEYNRLVGGQNTVYLQGTSTAAFPSRNHIRNNDITLDYIDDDLGHSLSRTKRDHQIWQAFKNHGAGDAIAVSVLNAGPGNEIYQNNIFKHFDGIDHVASLSLYINLSNPGPDRALIAKYNIGLKIYENTLIGLQDSGIEAVDGAVDVEWHDNIIKEATTCLRVKVATKGPLYIYRNRVSNVAQISYDGNPLGQGLDFTLGYDPDTPGAMYIYHNTFALGGNSLQFATPVSAPSVFALGNVWFINNIFSSSRLYTIGDFPEPRAHFDYNWAGGQFYVWYPDWPPASNNILAQNQTLWADRASVDFQLSPASPARAKGLDLSTAWTIDGLTKPALPGMAPGYFTGTQPDIGAVQYTGGQAEATPPEPPGLFRIR